MNPSSERTRKICRPNFGAVNGYAKRKGMIEPIFGQIKPARGFRQFLLRGMENMRGEWRLVCLTHNLLKLFRSQQVVSA